jgi:hypothetical protein
MPIREFLAGKSFDPETLAMLNAACRGACVDLGVTDKTPNSRGLVARKVLELSDGQRDPEAVRAAVVKFLKATR